LGRSAARLDGWQLTEDARRFDERAGGYVRAQPARNVLATILADTIAGRWADARRIFAWALDGQDVVAVALRTPPWPMAVAGVDDGTADALLDAWLKVDPDLPGVSGEPAAARAVGAAWVARTGGRTRVAMSEAMHQLSAVTEPPRPAPGELRDANEGDVPLLSQWEKAFRAEAGIGVNYEAEAAVRTRIARGSQLLWVDGAPVSTLAFSPQVAGTTRIGPVYTPPEFRSRGYASSAVAALSRRALAAGAERCMLLTDLANPTSNKIYASVGFRRFADWEEHAFEL